MDGVIEWERGREGEKEGGREGERVGGREERRRESIYNKHNYYVHVHPHSIDG